MKTEEKIIEEFKNKFDKNKILFKKSSGEIVLDIYLLDDIIDFWIKKLSQQKQEILKGQFYNKMTIDEEIKIPKELLQHIKQDTIQEVVKEVEKQLLDNTCQLKRSKDWIDEVKIKYGEYSKMFDDFSASDDGELDAALQQYNLQSGYAQCLYYIKSFLANL